MWFVKQVVHESYFLSFLKPVLKIIKTELSTEFFGRTFCCSNSMVPTRMLFLTTGVSVTQFAHAQSVQQGDGQTFKSLTCSFCKCTSFYCSFVWLFENERDCGICSIFRLAGESFKTNDLKFFRFRSCVSITSPASQAVQSSAMLCWSYRPVQ